MVKIVYVIPRYPALSETFIADEVMGIRALGHDVTVVSLARPSTEQIQQMGPRLAWATREVIYLQRVPITTASLNGMSRMSALALNTRISKESSFRTSWSVRLFRASEVARIVSHCQADLIYAHWPRGTEVALVAGEIARVPVGISIHAHEVAHDNGHFFLAFERVSFANFCNAAAMEYLLKTLPPSARLKSSLVYHGIDFSRFSRRQLPPLNETFHVVTAGRLSPSKGFQRLIMAVSLARQAGLPIKLTIIGEGSMRAELEGLVRKIGVEAHVRLVGWVPHEQMGKWLGSGHIFALLADTSYHDGLPNVVLESMAVGRPAIISPLPAAAEAVAHGQNGYILAAADAVDEFVGCCVRLSGSPKLLKSWSLAAATAVRSYHDHAVHLGKLSRIMTGAVNGGN